MLFACAPAPPEDSGVAAWTEPAPALVVSDTSLELGEIEVGERGAVVVTLTNTGDAHLHLDTPILESPSGQFDLLPPITPDLPPGGSVTFELGFEPDVPGGDSARILLPTDDPSQQLVTFVATATASAPVLTLDPSTLDFGSWGATCAIERTVTIRNDGDRTLTVDSVDLLGGGFEVDLNLLENRPLPWHILPGEPREVRVRFTPARPIAYAASLVVHSDDPVHENVAVALDGVGTENDQVEESYTAPGAPVDIVFAVEGDDALAAELAAAIPALTAPMSAVRLDWQVAAVRADDGCLTNGLVLNGSMTDEEQVSAFAGLLDASSDEHSLTLVERALAEAWSGGCNTDLLREVGKVLVVGVSETAAPAPEAAGYYAGLIDRVTTTPEGSAGWFIGPDGTCGTPDLAWTDVVSRTDGQYLSICDDLEATLAGLGGAAVERLEAFPLERVPVLDTLVVYLDEARTTDWTWDPDENVIRFTTPPPIGTRVRLAYDAAPVCE